QYDFEPTDLVALTQQTVKLMETYASERGVKLQLAFPSLGTSEPQAQVESQVGPLTPALSPSEGERENRPQFNLQPNADGKALQQALVNLIDNALKHSPKGETVTVGVEVQSPKSKAQSQGAESNSPCPASRFTLHASRLLLSVEDLGEGIPAAEHEKIFERFYRRGSELRRQTQGVGIGLSIVKHIVEAHGGKVLVRSAPGQGSRFTIELPLNYNEEAKPRSPEENHR